MQLSLARYGECLEDRVIYRGCKLRTGGYIRAQDDMNIVRRNQVLPDREENRVLRPRENRSSKLGSVDPAGDHQPYRLQGGCKSVLKGSDEGFIEVVTMWKGFHLLRSAGPIERR